MRKVKILIITQEEEISLFEVMAESLASKDFDIASNAVVLRNKILQLPVVELPDNFRLKVVDPARMNEGDFLPEKSHQEILDKKDRDQIEKDDIIRRTNKLTEQRNGLREISPEKGAQKQKKHLDHIRDQDTAENRKEQHT